MRPNYICALDLGSSKIAAALAGYTRKGVITDIFLESVPCRGVKMGKVVDSADFSDCVSRILRSLNARSGRPVKSVIVNIYGQDIITKHSRAIIPLTERGSKIITRYDIRKVIHEAQILGANIEEDIVHKIPISYTVDNQDGIADPLGLYGHKLEVDLYLICVKLPLIQGLNRAIEQAGCQMQGLFLSGLATSKIVFDEDDFYKGVHILCDIGSDITDILVFKDGTLYSIDTLSMGGDDLTQGFVQALKIPFALAKDLKESYGIVGPSENVPDKEVMIKEENFYRTISQKAICDILTSKAETLCNSIKSRLGRILAEESSVDDITVAGRTILVEGFLEMMEAKLGFPVKMASFANPELPAAVKKEASSSTARFLTYATSIGLIQQGVESTRSRGRLFSPDPTHNPVISLVNRAKELYQEYF
ncbi:MAG: cell division protein FtsA [Candidatus Omnitrophica bacterium]|nr:cell division protein FtsA [Candidatus Omnitrophota bacterium]